MIPNFTLIDKEISAYMLAALIGYFAAGFYACYAFRKRGRSEDDVISFYLLISVGALIGGSLLYGITNFPLLVKLMKLIFTGSFHSFGEFIGACRVVFGGSVFYGGLLGGMLVGIVLIHKKNLDGTLYTDALAPCIPLFHVFGRIGCFLSGCCFGIESKIGFVYHHSLIKVANGVRRFPIQLVEATFNLCLFLLLNHLFQKKKAEGNLLSIYLVLYAVGRFIIEFFRGDFYRGFLFSLSTSQIISLLILAGVVLQKVFEKRKKKDSIYHE